jgi:hypothetical protein
LEKGSHGLFTYDVTIQSADYDSINSRWMYTVKDHNGKAVDGETAETDLK